VRLARLGCLLLASLAVAPGRAAAADDPGFCAAIQDVLRASRTDFSGWRGSAREADPSSYESTRALPRASDCRIERPSVHARYVCEWEYRDYEEASARAATTLFLDGILECVGDQVQQARPSREGGAERREITLLVIRDEGGHLAEVRVSSWRSAKFSTWYVGLSVSPRSERR
jgi:hypothetical protein